VKLIDHPEAPGQAINVGSAEEVSITELANRVIALTGSHSKIRYVGYGEAYEEGFEDMPRRVPDTTRARNLIGFQPTVDLSGIIERVIQDQRS
jgi:UDP-glucose 4-epimerase